MFDEPLNNSNDYQTTDSFKSHENKDRYMTVNSDEDILWIRSVEESKILYGDKYNPKRMSGDRKKSQKKKCDEIFFKINFS